MITSTQKKRLLNNWGPKAEAMDCMVEVKFYDRLSPWECYVYAMNPEDEDEIECILVGWGVAPTTYKLSYVLSSFNHAGETPVIDEEFRPRLASEVLKDLKERHPE